MDLLYARYASPFIYLQGLMDTNNLLKGINYIFEQENERKMWDLYLHSFSSDSYDDWKKKIVSVKPIELNQKQIAKQIQKSNDILNNFHI